MNFELSFAGGPMERRYERMFSPCAELVPPRDLPLAARQLAADRWLANAHNEHHSAAIMAQVAQSLTLAQAPLDLTAVACGFAAQELRHAELCARLAMSLVDAPELRAPPPEMLAFAADTSFRQQADEAVLIACCISENLSLAWLRTMRRVASHAPARTVVGLLLKDEALHARFGWHYLAWACAAWSHSERERLSDIARQFLASYVPIFANPRSDDGVPALGILDTATQANVGLAASADVREQLESFGLSC